MKQGYRFYIFLIFFFLVNACTLIKPYYNEEARNWESNKATPDPSQLNYSIFLIGDVGAPNKDPLEPSLKLLQNEIMKAQEKSATVFLGDNIYNFGLTEPNAPGRKRDEERMNTQLDIFKGYRGEKYMIPGNHDWAQGTPGGLRAVIRQEAYVEAYLRDSTVVNGGNFYVPDQGCPGPFEVILQDDVVLIVLDSQWWLQDQERPYGANNYCDVTDEAEVLTQLEDVIGRNADKHVMVVAHHPLFTNGTHGGYFTLKDHFFPLTMLKDYLYLPMPIIGSIYPFARKYGGISQDVAHPKYQAFIQGLMGVFRKYPNVAYTAGHEHGLQYFKVDNVPTIVSGSGCKTQHIAAGGQAVFAHEAKGYVKVNYYQNGEVWAEFWEPVGDGSEGKMFYKTLMYKKEARAVVAKGQEPQINLRAGRPNYSDSTVTVAANPAYKAGAIKKVLLGEHYRSIWSTPVKMPLLDLTTEKGGLQPYRMGGGKQTISLRLRNEEGREYSLRSINKNPEAVLPEPLRETFARDILQDQISAQHPYGSLVLPTLSKAAGVFHVNPKLVYIPNDPLLGPYLPRVGNTVATLEENPDEDHQDVASLGYARNLVGTEKVLERKQADNDNVIDEKGFARARLFDMLIGDWDRHEGQWRWAERKMEEGRFYEPVPKDRDVAFFKADGLIPYLTTRKWAVRNFQNFGYDYNDYIGLNLTALTNDRTFLSSVTKEQWVAIAQDIKAKVTDNVIAEALRELPEEVYKQSAPELAAKLKSRRDLLPELAANYHTFLSKIVDVTGSDKREHFEIKRLEGGLTEVHVRNIKRDGTLGRHLYRRTFDPKETKEIRLYGLDGKDVFNVTGNANKGSLIRIIGGNDRDSIVDNSSVKGLMRRTYVYDTESNNVFHFGPETKNKTDDYPEVNKYERTAHKIPYVGPKISLQYNIDDRLYIGGGFVYRTHKFRKEPFAAQHTFLANYAFVTSAYNIRYNGLFTDVIKDWDLELHASRNGPQLLANYFGQGNRRDADESRIEDYRVRFSRYIASATLNYDVFHFVKVGIGPSFDMFQVERNETGAIARELIAQTEPTSFDLNKYLGARMFMNISAVDNIINPKIGIRWLNEANVSRQLGGENMSFTRFASEVRFYLTPHFPFQLTWAGRIGGTHNFGDYRFYQANTLGGTTNLRGYRIARYAGRSTLYANFEARVKLSNYNIYLFPGSFGVLGLVDHGRVFTDDDPSRNPFKGLHRGVGGGLWFDIAKQALISGTYTVGESEKLFNVTFGFLF
ncbi:metallophosphoesterase [Adhaeribacter aquaticus]|uniref:metallophosphoesterase n=1 Tax=Adhaeribacter aquaticus TaxID=299567 RepID=UPI0006881DFB|nr:metallophosphoesterase [Adhaeribacter aquaticus]